MDWQDVLKNALPLVVALLTVISAGVGIGLWLGILTTQQKQTKAELDQLRKQFDEDLTARRDGARERTETIEESLRGLSEKK